MFSIWFVPVLLNAGHARPDFGFNMFGDGNIEGYNVGTIQINEYGRMVTRYLLGAGYQNENIRTNGTSASFGRNTAAYVVKNGSFDSGNFSPDMFVEYNLLNKTVSFTVDLSDIECSCNAALFFTSQPAIGANGEPIAGTQGTYSCDANHGNGELCWEMDNMEANKYALQVTPHQCNSAPGTYISECDGAGCGTNLYNINNKGICPDSSCKINSNLPFEQSIYFGNNMYVTLTQGSNVIEFDVCSSNNDYIKSMNSPLNYGMSMILCYWGNNYNTMSWLDGKTGCTGDCPGTGYATFSDIKIL